MSNIPAPPLSILLALPSPLVGLLDFLQIVLVVISIFHFFCEDRLELIETKWFSTGIIIESVDYK